MTRTLLILILSVFLSLSCSSVKNKLKKNKVDYSKSAIEYDEYGIPRRRKKILVVQVFNKTELGGSDLIEHASEAIEEWVSLNTGFIVMPQVDLDSEVIFLDENNEFDLPKIYQAIRETDISAILLPTIEEIRFREAGDEQGFFRERELTTYAQVRVQVIDAITQSEIYRRRLTAKYTEEATKFMGKKEGEIEYNERHGKRATQRAFEEALEPLPKYAKRIDWKGRVARIEGARHYIDGGRITGLRVGQVLSVYDKPRIISGVGKAKKKKLGVSRGRFKGTLKIIRFVGEDAALAMVHSGGDFAAEDLVEYFLPDK